MATLTNSETGQKTEYKVFKDNNGILTISKNGKCTMEDVCNQTDFYSYVYDLRTKLEERNVLQNKLRGVERCLFEMEIDMKRRYILSDEEMSLVLDSNKGG